MKFWSWPPSGNSDFLAKASLLGSRLRRQFGEGQPRRQRHADAERQRLARAERGHEGEQVGGGVRYGRAQQRLVAVVGHAHREQRAALGDDRRIELGRTLRDEAEIDAVLAALLGDAGDRAPRRTEAGGAVGGGVAVGLFANEQQRRGAVAPQAEIEGHAAEHRHHRVDHLGRETGELHDRHRLAVGRQPEQLADRFRHRVAADIGVLEHEGVARVVADRLDARHQLVVVHARRAVLELAHALVDHRSAGPPAGTAPACRPCSRCSSHRAS